MADKDLAPIPHFVALPPHTDNPDEPVRYDCSLCDDDIYNISMHAQFGHAIKDFTVDNVEQVRDYGVVGHPCGVSGCSFPGNHEGGHSWQRIEPTSSIKESSVPAVAEVIVPDDANVPD